MTLKRRKSSKSDRKYWIDQLDKVFSMYIRLRDSRPYRFAAFRCISCGEEKPFSEMDAGHFVSRNNMKLRWNPQNVHGECAHCNRFQGSHLIGYRKNLIIKLGTEAVKNNLLVQALSDDKKLQIIKRLGTKQVEDIEAQRHDTKKWSVEELKQEYMYFAALVLDLKNQM